MKNIVLARIDDRLIHGQVVTAWLKSVKVQSILSLPFWKTGESASPLA